MIPVHAKPDDAEEELDELYNVFKAVKKKLKTKVKHKATPAATFMIYFHLVISSLAPNTIK